MGDKNVNFFLKITKYKYFLFKMRGRSLEYIAKTLAKCRRENNYSRLESKHSISFSSLFILGVIFVKIKCMHCLPCLKKS